MRVLATTLVLVVTAVPAARARAEAADGGTGAGDVAAGAAASPAADPAPAATPSAGAEPAPRKAPAVPLQAVVDKVGQGDRLALAGDHRGALFAYQDAVYLQPTYAPARVRLGRAYLALRYPEQAIAQAEAALAEDPDSAEARKLLDEARAAPPRPKVGAVVAPAAPGPGAAAAAAPPAAKPGGRVFKLPQDGEATSARAAPAPAPAAPRAAAPGAGTALAAPAAAGAGLASAAAAADALGAPADAPEPDLAGAEPPSAAQRQVAALHYRTALGFLQNRDWAKAVAALSDAILADPTLAVAYSARGSAQFGLGKYRDAAEDYGAAVRLDPRLGTPIYGLAECYRVLGDGKKAAEMYDRYARSTASDVRDDLRAIAAKRAKELR